MNNISDLIFACARKLRLIKQRKKLKQTRCTIISNNCLAGFLYHDFGMRFDSPTINLIINAYDYCRFLNYIYNREDISNIVDITSSTDLYPQGLLNGDVRISFVHYESFEDGLRKWKERVSRIDFDNIYVIFTESSVKRELIEEFDKLLFKNKIALVHKKMPDVKSSNVIRGFETEERMGYIFGKYRWWGVNYYDQVDWVEFLNQK